MRKSKKSKIIDYLEGKNNSIREGLEKERQELETLQEILKKEEDFHPPAHFWTSYLPNLRRRIGEKGGSRLRLVPILASALSLLVVAFLLFHSQIYPPNPPPSNLKRIYWDRELSEISSISQMEKLSTSLVQTFRLNDLQKDITEFTPGRLNSRGLGEVKEEELSEILTSQLGNEINLVSDILYQELDIDELTGELSPNELQELKNQLKGT